MKPTPGTLLVTHRLCLDGTGSALMFLFARGRREMVRFRNPSGLILDPQEVSSEVTEVWYADCCPADLTDPAAGRPFRVFDHHVSSMRRHGQDPRCVFDMGRSGTTLMAYALELDESPGSIAFLKAMEDYDLGRFGNVNGVMLADLASTYSQDDLLDLLFERYSVAHLDEVLYDEMLTERAAAAAALRSIYCEQASRSAVSTTIAISGIGTVRIVAAALPRDWKNEAAAQMLRASPEADVALVIDVMGGMASLRSREGGPDCSVIAGQYGGGGHARSAGFKIPGGARSTTNALIKEALG